MRSATGIAVPALWVRAHILDGGGLRPSGDTEQRVRFLIGWLENEAREISRKNDAFARAACDFEDYASCRRDIGSPATISAVDEGSG